MSEDMTIEKNYPIIEALAEFRFEPIDLTEERVNAIQDVLKDDYPELRPIKTFTHQFVQSESSSSQSHEEAPRYQFFSLDKLSLVQVDSRLFTLNRLNPYYRWEQFRPDIIKVVERMTGVLNTQLNEVVLQYINRIPISLGDDLEKLMHFRPLFDGPFTACSAAVIIPNESIKGTLQMMMQTITEPDGSGAVMFNLTTQSQTNNFDEALLLLNAAHDLLDTQFKACVGDAVLEGLK